jgi:metal-dependent amidase/aminoacylase/carboxypeptidase family protein
MAQLRQIVPPDAVRSSKNTSGSTISKGYIVKRKAATDEIELVSAATDAILGVAMHDIPNGEFGDVQVAGRALVLTAATVTIGARLTGDSAGKAAASSGGNALLGVANTVGGTDALAEVDLGVGASH